MSLEFNNIEHHGNVSCIHSFPNEKVPNGFQGAVYLLTCMYPYCAYAGKNHTGLVRFIFPQNYSKVTCDIILEIGDVRECCENDNCNYYNYPEWEYFNKEFLKNIDYNCASCFNNDHGIKICLNDINGDEYRCLLAASNYNTTYMVKGLQLDTTKYDIQWMVKSARSSNNNFFYKINKFQVNVHDPDKHDKILIFDPTYKGSDKKSLDEFINSDGSGGDVAPDFYDPTGNSSSPSPTALHRIDHYVSVNNINDPKLDISMVVNKVIWDIKTQTLYYINKNGMCMKLGPK